MIPLRKWSILKMEKWLKYKMESDPLYWKYEIVLFQIENRDFAKNHNMWIFNTYVLWEGLKYSQFTWAIWIICFELIDKKLPPKSSSLLLLRIWRHTSCYKIFFQKFKMEFFYFFSNG